ncbi:unnamed protein product [Rotaria magnacalcarata]|uniref:Atlastin n=1 Tax=Rotaria magnacalcarata TaxID=392030 RepID=A0A8S3B641_9BILA|nr:unnamed protein product [Rotaria magnacalcarata]
MYCYSPIYCGYITCCPKESTISLNIVYNAIKKCIAHTEWKSSFSSMFDNNYNINKATAEANNLAAKSASKEFYIRAMEQHCGGDRPYIHPNQLEALHKETDRQAVEKFRCVRKMGGEEVSMVYQKNLEDEIIELYSNYKKHNDSKNVFAFSRTPTTFISSMILCYFVAGILDTIWLGGINFIFMFAFWVCFFLLFVWLYTKYSGEYADIGQYIDYFADVIWNNAFQPAYSTCLQSAMRSVLGHAKTN